MHAYCSLIMTAYPSDIGFKNSYKNFGILLQQNFQFSKPKSSSYLHCLVVNYST